MALLHWRENLSVGVPAIDKDHRQLIDALNQLHVSVVLADNPAVIVEAMSALVHAEIEHFRREEALMRMANYPGLAAHSDIHRQMAKRAGDMEASFRKQLHLRRLHTFCGGVADWLLLHVLQEDVKLRPFVAHLPEAQAA
ncbi:MAG: hemerythrin family protein [Rhodospirillales bacterium]|nr:hemerythrin family protein [Rhodospirillales bacterium]